MPNAAYEKYVDYRLDEWARWYRNGNDCHLGFPRESLLYRLLHIGYVSHNPGQEVLPTNEAAEEMERYIVEMGQHEKLWVLILREYYLGGKDDEPIQSRIKKLGIGKTTFHSELKQAKAWLMGRLSAIYTTVPSWIGGSQE